MNLRDYRLLSQLGAGADGVSYRACDPATTGAVEIRVLSGAHAEAHRWRVVARQLRLAAMFEHPAAITIHDLNLEQDPPYVALEWVDGQSLADGLQAQLPLPGPTAFAMGHDLAAVLAAAHRLGLVHGRLSPEDIRRTSTGRLKVDFTGLAIATPPPSSSSVWQPPDSSPAAFTDVWSLGTVLCWLLSGSSTATLAINEPGELTSLVQEMIAEDPAERPSAAAVEERLGVLLGLGKATHVPPGPTVILPAPASANEAVLEPLQRQLGRFRLREKLGEGGLGEVYRAEDPIDGSEVAIKVLHPQWAGQPGALRRFHKEARLLAEVNNPYVANLIESNEDNGIHYLALELVNGQSLAHFLAQRRRLDEPLALAIMADVARALVDAHRRGIVHRDIKPENILLIGSPDAVPTESPRIKVCDFGVARHVVESASLNVTDEGTAVGTCLYMPPEQAAGTGVVDARSDVYAMGATLFHLLAGRPPFLADTALGLLALHSNEPPPDLQRLNPAVSDGACHIVSRALAKHPEARYADAGAMLQDLERLLRGEPAHIQVHPRLPVYDPHKLLHYDWSWELDASPEQLWPYVADTDRVNQAVGLPAMQATTQVDSSAGALLAGRPRVRRFVSFRKAGVTSAWEEHPFEWVEGRRHGVLRECSQGPFKWLMTVVELTPRAGGGTTLHHRVQIEPHGLLGRLVAAMEVGTKGHRAVDRVYRHIDAFLTAAARTRSAACADPFVPARGLARGGRHRLDRLLDRLRAQQIDPAVVDALGDFVARAPAKEIARIRPLRLARRLGLDPDQVVTACLHGAREGLLIQLWDILCPTCRIPSEIKDSLRLLEAHGHCTVCHLDFELDFANSVEMIFRVHPEIRASDLATYCIGGPAHSPHVVAQVRVAPGERFELELALAEGGYRLRGPQLPFAFDFRVEPSAALSRCEVNLSQGPDSQWPDRLQTGRQVLVLSNAHSQELVVRVERTAPRADALTAARASSLALFRELFPNEVLSPGQLVNVTTVTVLVTELDQAVRLYQELGEARAFRLLHNHFRQVGDGIREAGGAVVKQLEEGLVGTFTDPVAAVRVGLDLLAQARETRDGDGVGRRLRVGIHRGPALMATLNDRLDYFGTTISQAARLPQVGGDGDLILTSAVAADPQVDRLLRSRGLHDEVIAVHLLPGEPDSFIHRLLPIPPAIPRTPSQSASVLVQQ